MNVADSRRNFYILSPAAALAEDRAYASEFLVSIVAAASYYIVLMTNGSPIQIPSFTIETLSIKTRLDLIAGGTFSGGGPLPLSNLNLAINNPPSLVTRLDGGVTEDVAGTISRTGYILGSGARQNRQVASGNEGAGTILPGATQVAIKITNEDAATQDFDFALRMNDLDGFY